MERTSRREQSQSLSCRLSLPYGLLRIGIVNEEPPYAEPHVRWCERSENESRRKTTSFSSYSILEGAVAHATRGGNRRQEGRERGYYHLHRNLNDPLFHTFFFLKLKGS